MPILLLLLYFCSGLAALVYEVTWLKLLAGLLTNSSHALSLVLSGYLLGLALGSRECGRHGHLIARPVAAYALLEALVALVAWSVPHLLRLICEAALRWLSPEVAHVLRMLLCGGTLLCGSFFIGATFPLQIRAFAPAPVAALRAAAFILAFQTAGGVAGVLLSGFVFLPSLGIAHTHWIAISCSLCVALGAWLLSRREPPRAAEKPLPEVGGMATFSNWRFRALTLSVGLVGGASLALEVLYTRVLAFFLPDLAYSFSAVLAVYLFAVAMGSLLAVWILRRVSSLAASGTLVVVAGTVVIASLSVVGTLYRVFHEFEVRGGGYQSGSFWMAALSGSLLLIALPAALLGAFLPVGIGLLAPGHGSAPSAAAAFSSNSIGSASGALLAGMLLIPVAGVKGSILLVGGIVVVTGLVMVFIDRVRLGPLQPMAFVSGAALLALFALYRPLAILWPVLLWALRRRYEFSAKVAGVFGCCLVIPLLCRWGDPHRPLILDSAVFQREGEIYRSARLLESREGTVATASVVERGGESLLYTDAFQAAGTGRSYRYMKMLGHLPMLLLQEAHRVLVIAFGTGTTCGSLVLHPDLHQLSVVEISPEVLALAPHFAAVNHGLPQSNRGAVKVDVSIDDGRAFLRRTRATFDLISLEPLLPATPAAIHFYTREFFDLARSRLVEGGLLCHWIPIHAQRVHSLRAMLGTFFEVFAESDLFLFGNSLVLLGWNGAQRVAAADVLARRFAEPAVLKDVREAGLARLEEVFGCYVGSAPALAPICAGVELVTDDHPHILYDEIRPYLDRLEWHEQAVEFLYSAAPGEPPWMQELAPNLLATVRRSRSAKQKLRQAEALLEGETYRFRRGQAEGVLEIHLVQGLAEGQRKYRNLLARALLEDPLDTEANELAHR